MSETLPKRFASVKDNYLPIAAYGDLVRRVLGALRLKPSQLASKINKSGRAVEKWLAGDNKPDVPSLANMKRLVESVDPALAMDLQHAIDNYVWHTRARTGERERMMAVVDEFTNELHTLARHRNELDTSYILREALTLGFAALSPATVDWKALGKRQAKISKEVHQRAEPRGKAK